MDQKGFGRSDRGIIESLSQHLPGVSKETLETAQP
jgi:hypothetical protein